MGADPLIARLGVLITRLISGFRMQQIARLTKNLRTPGGGGLRAPICVAHRFEQRWPNSQQFILGERLPQPRAANCLFRAIPRCPLRGRHLCCIAAAVRG